MLIPAVSLLFYSSLGIAGYKCQEKDSSFVLTQKSHQEVKVQLSNGMILSGHQEVKNSKFYKVETFNLQDLEGDIAQLKVATINVMSRVPCTGRRICDEDSYFNTKISADLDYQGKVTSYDCSTTF